MHVGSRVHALLSRAPTWLVPMLLLRDRLPEWLACVAMHCCPFAWARVNASLHAPECSDGDADAHR